METFTTVEGGTTWDDYPHFVWIGYPMFPWDLMPPTPQNAGIYTNRVNAWNKIAYYFRSPVKTINKAGKYRVTWKAQHDLATYNTATRYFIQLVDTDGNLLYKSKTCPKCYGDGSDCDYCIYMNTSTVDGDPESHDCTCCKDANDSCIRCEYDYFGEFVSGDDQELSFDVDIPAGKQVRIVYARNNGYGITVKQATINELHTVTIGDDEYTVEDGDDFHLPEGPEYGYLIDDELYPSDYDITVDKDIVAIPINKLDISMYNGASIRKSPPAGIAFGARIDTEAALLNSSVYESGMLITTFDMYHEEGDYVLDLNSTYDVKRIKNNGWLPNNFGSFRCGIVNLQAENNTVDYIARAYVKLNYVNNTNRVVYSGMSDKRNIKQVANLLIEKNLPGEVTDFVRQCAQ